MTKAFKIRRFLTAMVAIVALSACGERTDEGFQGYAEGEYVRVAAPFAGTLEMLQAQRGAQVNAGDPLFTL